LPTRISIITPVFNGEKFILEAVRSVQNQSCHDWEWLIINDGSTDETPVLLNSLDDPRIHVIHQDNFGASRARNAGLDRATGDYITFLDADDLLPENALELRAAVLDANPDIDIVNGGVEVTAGGHLQRVYNPCEQRGPLLGRLARLDEGVFFNVNYMIRRDEVGNHRFADGLTHCEDLIFFLELAHERDLQYGAVEDIVYQYRIQTGSAMTSLDGIERGYMEVIRRSQKMPRIDPAARAAQLRRIRRILVRSWLRRFRPDRSVSALFILRKALRAGT